ncbi:phytanoyl-CoA dioxygenase family protein [Chloroflexi bacterium TSY]|nr:phytanoyl-CoA dioxygenase family protein [Chloroflexi bacterium TSY]
MSEQMGPFINAKDLLETPDQLRATMKKNGYLFLPGLLTRAVVGEVYDSIMNLCKEHEWAHDDGRAKEPVRLEGEDAFWEVYDPLQKLELFHGLAHRPELLNVIEILTQDTPFVHPRNIARIAYPQAEHFTTPPHQDFVHIQGTAETYTCWFPLSDCPQHMGSLVVLAGSHQQDVLPVHRATGAGGLGVDTGPLNLVWHGSDFRAGDVLFFHSHTVHKALPNRTKDTLRISVDYRYQGVSQPIVGDGLEPHYMRLSWDEIYEGWTQPELQYYWRDLGLKIAERDRSYQENAVQPKGAAQMV